MTKFYRSSESGPEELVLTPRATDTQVEAAWQALFDRGIGCDVGYVRAALAAAQAVAPDVKKAIQKEHAMYEHGYQEGFGAGYAQAIGDADAALQKHGDDRQTRLCRRDVLALANVSYEPEHAMPQVDWSKYHAPGCPAPAPWPTEDLVIKTLYDWIDENYSPSKFNGNSLKIHLRVAFDALYRNALCPKVKP